MLLRIPMGYQFSRHASLASYSLYWLLYGREPVFPTFIHKNLVFVVDLDDPNMWTKCV